MRWFLYRDLAALLVNNYRHTQHTTQTLHAATRDEAMIVANNRWQISGSRWHQVPNMHASMDTPDMPQNLRPCSSKHARSCNILCSLNTLLWSFRLPGSHQECVHGRVHVGVLFLLWIWTSLLDCQDTCSAHWPKATFWLQQTNCSLFKPFVSFPHPHRQTRLLSAPTLKPHCVSLTLSPMTIMTSK